MQHIPASACGKSKMHLGTPIISPGILRRPAAKASYHSDTIDFSQTPLHIAIQLKPYETGRLPVSSDVQLGVESLLVKYVLFNFTRLHSVIDSVHKTVALSSKSTSPDPN